MEKKTPNIRILAENQAQEALSFLESSGRAYDAASIEKLQSGLASGAWRFVMASMEGRNVGCFYLNLQPKYHVYRALKVPEMQDLRVLSGFRRQGIGGTLVEYAEQMAKDLGAPGLGISVGLDASYGAAQILYGQMGYIPDGNGVTVEREPVNKGQKIILDDNACLMLLKLF